MDEEMIADKYSEEIPENYLHISKDWIYNLIKEMKEAYRFANDDTPSDAVKRHNLKIKYKLLETLLAEKLDGELQKALNVKKLFELSKEIKGSKVIKVHTFNGLVDYVEGLPEGVSYEVVDDE